MFPKQIGLQKKILFLNGHYTEDFLQVLDFFLYVFYLIFHWILQVPLDATEKKINIKHILQAKDNGYSFFWESCYILYKKKYKIYEIPISLPYRSVGSSKMKIKDILHALYYLFIVSIKKI